MTIATINITCETSEDDPFFHELAINRFPIIVFDEPDIDRFVRTSQELQDIVMSYIKTESMFETAFLNIRAIKNGDVTDRCIKIRDVMTFNKNNEQQNG